MAGSTPAVAPPPGHPRFPLIDALRAIAALSVLVTHTGFVSGAILNGTYGSYVARLEAGVALFFLISGFLLYRPFVSTRLNGARAIPLRDYARRRLLRIVPAYWLALTVLAIWPGLPGVFTSHWWVYYGFLQIYSNSTVLNGIGPAWSLCVEITFYALLPLFALGVARLVAHRSRATQVLLELGLLELIGGASLMLRGWLRTHDFTSFLLNTLPTHMDWFAAGMALAVVSAALQGTAQRPWAVRVVQRLPVVSWALAGVAFWAVSRHVDGPELVNVFGHPALIYTARQDVLRHFLYACAALGLLLPAVIGGELSGGLVRRLLSWRILGLLGLVSYGIYLWQTPLLTWICDRGRHGMPACRFHGATALADHPFIPLTVLAFVAVLACSVLSYRLVERPILRLKNGRPRPST